VSAREKQLIELMKQTIAGYAGKHAEKIMPDAFPDPVTMPWNN
jgi:hypothetical protein